MVSDADSHAEHVRFLRVDAAVRAGDLAALVAAVGEDQGFPNVQLSMALGYPLEYAIHWGPIPLIRALLELGADPNPDVHDGFPPLIAALSCSRSQPGSLARPDVDDIVRVLIEAGADPNQRGINDYTALHMAVSEGNKLAVQRLLDAGADPDLRTRVDDCMTAQEMAEAAGLVAIAETLARRGEPLRRRLRSGLQLQWDVAGDGEPVRRQHRYRVRLRMWLHQGEAVQWSMASGPVGIARLEDGGSTLFTEVRVDRHSLIAGLFYGVDGMFVGGTRKLEIAPHLAYGDAGVAGIIPANALLTVEITVLDVATK